MNYQLMRTTLFCLTLLFYASLRVHASQAESFYLKSVDVDIEVETSGDLLVSETLSYVFTERTSNQRIRHIPLSLIDRITDVQVYENGQKIRSKTRVGRDQLSIRWHHQLNKTGIRTFVLQYRAQGAVRVDERHDQVVWPAVFEKHPARIETSQVTVRVPPSLAGQIQNVSHYGVPTVSRQLDARTVTFSPRGELQPDEGLTVKLYVPHGRLSTDIPAWQRGEEVEYRLPGLVGYIDTLMFIGLAFGLPAVWLLASNQKLQWEMERKARQGGVTNP